MVSKIVRFFFTLFWSHRQSTVKVLKGSMNLIPYISSQVESILGNWVGNLEGTLLDEGCKLGKMLGLLDILGARVGRDVGFDVGRGTGAGVGERVGKGIGEREVVLFGISVVGGTGASLGEFEGEKVGIASIASMTKSCPVVSKILFASASSNLGLSRVSTYSLLDTFDMSDASPSKNVILPRTSILLAASLRLEAVEPMPTNVTQQ
jgi:hypothetical protein